MTEAQILDILRQGLWTALVISTPILAVALIVGLAIGLLQALTSVQEMTLTFVPKLGAILIVFWISMSFSGRHAGAVLSGPAHPDDRGPLKPTGTAAAARSSLKDAERISTAISSAVRFPAPAADWSPVAPQA